MFGELPGVGSIIYLANLVFLRLALSSRLRADTGEAGETRRMAHKIAKLMLEGASTFLDRTKAVETAFSMGMPLAEIEEYLDWIDMVKSDRKRGSAEDSAEDSAGDADAPDSARRPRAG